VQQIIKELAEAYSLGDWKLAADLSTGFVNENYRIDTASSHFFLRIYRQQPLESVESKMDLFCALSEIDYPTAYPIAKSDGDFVSQTERGVAVLYEFLDGETPDVTYDTAFQIGTAIGKLSNLKSRWQSRTNKINMAYCETTLPLLSTLTTHSRLLESFEHYTGVLKEVAQADLPTGVIHSDVFPDNTIFQDGQLTGIIDFDDFCHETLLFELAMAINGFGFVDNQLVESPLKGVCIGYSKQRKLDDEELRLLPRYIQLTALAMSCWHINNGIIDSSNSRSIARAEELVGRVIELEGRLEELGGWVTRCRASAP
jgi:homoserine kinase type II